MVAYHLQQKLSIKSDNYQEYSKFHRTVWVQICYGATLIKLLGIKKVPEVQGSYSDKISLTNSIVQMALNSLQGPIS